MPTPSPRPSLREIARPEVAAVFAAYPDAVRQKLLDLRRLILDTAATTDGVGELEEALRWGQPSYLTATSKSGSTIRIHTVRGAADQYALYVNCQTTLVGRFQQMYPDLFSYDGNRALTFHVDDSVPRDALSHCIAMTLCYHLDKKGAPGA